MKALLLLVTSLFSLNCSTSETFAAAAANPPLQAAASPQKKPLSLQEVYDLYIAKRPKLLPNLREIYRKRVDEIIAGQPEREYFARFKTASAILAEIHKQESGDREDIDGLEILLGPKPDHTKLPKGMRFYTEICQILGRELRPYDPPETNEFALQDTKLIPGVMFNLLVSEARVARLRQMLTEMKAASTD